MPVMKKTGISFVLIDNNYRIGCNIPFLPPLHRLSQHWLEYIYEFRALKIFFLLLSPSFTCRFSFFLLHLNPEYPMY